MKEYLVIGISGKMQSGKTTAAQLIKKDLESRIMPRGNPMVVKILPFAQKLKDIAIDLYGWDGDKGIYLNDKGIAIKDKGRQLLIELGRKMREIRPTIWVDYLYKKIDYLINNRSDEILVIIVDDVRYLNELEKLANFERSFRAIRIERMGIPTLNDPSETGLDNGIEWHKIFYNNSTIDDLGKELGTWLDSNL